MTGGEKGQWPSHLAEWQKKATINGVRNAAVQKVLRHIILLDNPFKQTPQLEGVLYWAVGKIARLPQEANHIHQAAIAFKDISFYLAANKSSEELKRKVDEMRAEGAPYIPNSVLEESSKNMNIYEGQMRTAIDGTLRSILSKPEIFSSRNVRDIIQSYLQTREQAKIIPQF